MSKRDDPLLIERVARLEADVKWLKKLITPSLLIQSGTFITVIVIVLKLMFGG
jgi:hypothetical protein